MEIDGQFVQLMLHSIKIKLKSSNRHLRFYFTRENKWKTSGKIFLLNIRFSWDRAVWGENRPGTLDKYSNLIFISRTSGVSWKNSSLPTYFHTSETERLSWLKLAKFRVCTWTFKFSSSIPSKWNRPLVDYDPCDSYFSKHVSGERRKKCWINVEWILRLRWNIKRKCWCFEGLDVPINDEEATTRFHHRVIEVCCKLLQQVVYEVLSSSASARKHD